MCRIKVPFDVLLHMQMLTKPWDADEQIVSRLANGVCSFQRGVAGSVGNVRCRSDPVAPMSATGVALHY